MIKYCAKKKETEDCIWSVFTSFGYIEAENKEVNTGKLCYFNDNKAVIEKKGNITIKDKAEFAAIIIEAVIANGLDEFTVEVENDEVFELLTLFGFEKFIKKSDKNGFKMSSDGIEIAKSSDVGVIIDIGKLLEALEKAGINTEDIGVQASLIFAEKNAEGLAYDVAYNLRVNGCIVEYYTEDDSIENACNYAQNNGMSCVMRTYPDGILQIKDMIKNEITETTVDEFLGYYEDEECDCGHDHHDHDCDCGHHH